MDPSALLSFLSTPRSITEVAEHFRIPLTQAERLVVDAMESGKVLVSSQSVGHGGGEGRLPRTAVQKVSTRTKLDYAKLRFELRRGEPNLVHDSSKPAGVLELFGTRKKPARVSSVSPPFLMELLEKLEGSSKSLTALRADLDISQRLLKRLVRKRMLDEVWGAKGVGLLYKITDGGLSELRRLREVSTMANRLSRRPLPSLKLKISS